MEKKEKHSVLIEKKLPDGRVIGVKFTSEELEDFYNLLNNGKKEKNQ